MPRIRPRERDRIVDVLVGGIPREDVTDEMLEDASEMATDILVLIDEMREQRPDYFVIKIDPGVCVSLHGPYVTKNAAKKEIEKGDLVAASPGANALIVQRIQSHYEGVLPL